MLTPTTAGCAMRTHGITTVLKKTALLASLTAALFSAPVSANGNWADQQNRNEDWPHATGDVSSEPGYWMGHDGTLYPTRTVYTIDTPQKLAQFAYLVNNGSDNFFGAIVRLTANINLSEFWWTAIGNEADVGNLSRIMPTQAFSGIFDGAYFTISGLRCDAANSAGQGTYSEALGVRVPAFGLFGMVGGQRQTKAMDPGLAVIQALNLQVEHFVADGIFCGALAGWMSFCEVRDVTVSSSSGAPLYAIGDLQGAFGGPIPILLSDGVVGGLVGLANDVWFSTCKNNLPIIAAKPDNAERAGLILGGLVGFGACVLAADCENLASISTAPTIPALEFSDYAPNGFDANGYGIAIGGLFGCADYTHIIDCANHGALSAQAQNELYIGGLAGITAEITGTTLPVFIYDGTSFGGEVLITTSHNTAKVSGAVGSWNDTCLVGGLVGYIQAGILDDCHNRANLYGDTDIGARLDIGGIAGRCGDGSGTILNIIRNCSNSGNVEAVQANVGGIAGQTWNTCIENCWNAGNLLNEFLGSTFSSYSGGIVGDSHGDDIVNCYSSAAQVTGDYVGGLVGSLDSYIVNGFWYDQNSALPDAYGVKSGSSALYDIGTFGEPDDGLNDGGTISYIQGGSSASLLDTLNDWVTDQNNNYGASYLPWNLEDSYGQGAKGYPAFGPPLPKAVTTYYLLSTATHETTVYKGHPYQNGEYLGTFNGYWHSGGMFPTIQRHHTYLAMQAIASDRYDTTTGDYATAIIHFGDGVPNSPYETYEGTDNAVIFDYLADTTLKGKASFHQQKDSSFMSFIGDSIHISTGTLLIDADLEMFHCHFYGNASVTIAGGTLSIMGADSCIDISDSATLVIEGGDFHLTSLLTGIAALDDATLTINNGTFQMLSAIGFVAFDNDESVSLTINGGQFTSGVGGLIGLLDPNGENGLELPEWADHALPLAWVCLINSTAEINGGDFTGALSAFASNDLIVDALETAFLTLGVETSNSIFQDIEELKSLTTLPSTITFNSGTFNTDFAVIAGNPADTIILGGTTFNSFSGTDILLTPEGFVCVDDSTFSATMTVGFTARSVFNEIVIAALESLIEDENNELPPQLTYDDLFAKIQSYGPNGQLVVQDGAAFIESFIPLANPSERFLIDGNDLIYGFGIPVEVTFWASDGDPASQTVTQYIYPGATYRMPPEQPTSQTANTLFAGWYATDGIIDMTMEQITQDTPFTDASPTDIYANWETCSTWPPPPMAVHYYDGIGGGNGSLHETLPIQIGDNYTHPALPPVHPDDYSFLGWVLQDYPDIQVTTNWIFSSHSPDILVARWDTGDSDPDDMGVHIDQILVSPGLDVKLAWASNPIKARLGANYRYEVLISTDLLTWGPPAGTPAATYGLADELLLPSTILPTSERMFFKVQAIKQ